MKQKLFSILTLGIILLACTALYFSGNYVIFILAYVFAFVFLLCYAVFSASTIPEKIAQIIVYALIMVSQILFDTLVIRKLQTEYDTISRLGSLIGILLIFIPFFVKQLFFAKQHNATPFTSLGECSALSYSQLLHDKNEILCKIDELTTARKKLSKQNIYEIIHDLSRHNSFSYINNGSLTKSYFERAAETLHDGYIYLILTKSKSASSEVIGLFTHKQYNHISLSFDKELHTIISYNGGEKIAPEVLRRNHHTVRDGASYF